MRNTDSTDLNALMFRYAAFRSWLFDEGETNNEQLERLRKNLAKAIKIELTDTERRAVIDVCMKGVRVMDAAQKYGVSRCTVSKTIMRAKRKLRKVLEYSL